MIKGKSTIQLFDANSGKLKHQEENTNIVTNAIQDIINYNDPYGLAARRIDTFFQQNQMYPFTTTAFGGLLLWSDNIEENPAITMPPNGILEVGHAGGQYGGDNTCRGSYNTNESGVIDEEDRKGYRHVWDFGTDKANGTIKCLSLTSLNGGNIGYRNEVVISSSSNTSIVPYGQNACFLNRNSCDNTSNCLPSTNLTNWSDLSKVLKVRTGSNSVIFTVVAGVNSTQVYEVTIPLPANKFSLLSNPNIVPASSKVLIDNMASSANYKSLVYLYNGKIYLCYAKSTEIVINSWTENGEKLDDIIVTPQKKPYAYSSPYYYNNAAFYYGGAVYYRINSSTLAKCDIDGNEIEGTINLRDYYTNSSGSNITGSSGAVDVKDDGNLYFNYYRQVSSSYYRGVVIIAPDEKVAVSPIQGYDQSGIYRSGGQASIKSPLLYRLYYDSSNALYFSINVDPRYLATINNLATPVTKTEAQTMKVTYELIEA